MNWWEYFLNLSAIKWLIENSGWIKGIAAFFGINILLRKRIKMWWDKTKIIVGTHVEVGVIKQTLTQHIAEQHRVNHDLNSKLDLILKEVKAADNLDWALRGLSDDSYFAADVNGDIRIVSKSILRIIGCSREEFIGSRWLTFIKNTIERQRVKALWDECFENLNTFEEDVTMINNSNIHVHIRIKCAPVFSESDGAVQGWAGAFEKI